MKKANSRKLLAKFSKQLIFIVAPDDRLYAEVLPPAQCILYFQVAVNNRVSDMQHYKMCSLSVSYTKKS